MFFPLLLLFVCFVLILGLILFPELLGMRLYSFLREQNITSHVISDCFLQGTELQGMA